MLYDADYNWSNPTSSLERFELSGRRTSRACGGASVFVCYVLCMVMGSSWLVDTQRNFSSGDKNFRVCMCSELQHALHLHHCSGILVDDVPHACLHIFLLCCLDCGHGVVRVIPLA